jgi:hypothetical protein
MQDCASSRLRFETQTASSQMAGSCGSPRWTWSWVWARPSPSVYRSGVGGKGAIRSLLCSSNASSRQLGARLRNRQRDAARCAERRQPPLQASAQASRAARHTLARPQALVLHAAAQQGRAPQVRPAPRGARQHTAHPRPLLALDADHGQAHRECYGLGSRRRGRSAKVRQECPRQVDLRPPDRRWETAPYASFY